jgi:hypothetical protein
MNTTVTLNEAPSKQVVAKMAAKISVTDSKGRVIGLRKPGLLAQYRIIEVMGESADIATYRSMVTPLIYISSFDGDPESPPVNKMQLEALIKRVGEEGLEAIVRGIVEHFGNRDADADKAELKNS